MTDKANNDPAYAMNENAKALAEQRKLNVYLDEILAFEKKRADASRGIADVWKRVAKAGIDISTARRALVYRACDIPTNS